MKDHRLSWRHFSWQVSFAAMSGPNSCRCGTRSSTPRNSQAPPSRLFRNDENTSSFDLRPNHCSAILLEGTSDAKKLIVKILRTCHGTPHISSACRGSNQRQAFAGPISPIGKVSSRSGSRSKSTRKVGMSELFDALHDTQNRRTETLPAGTPCVEYNSEGDDAPWLIRVPDFGFAVQQNGWAGDLVLNESRLV